MSTKLPTIQTFMVEEDERAFSKALREQLPGMVFVNTGCWPDPDPTSRVYDSIADCADFLGGVALLNTEICSLERYAREYVFKNEYHGYYEPSEFGCGCIQYLRSKMWTGAKEPGLNNGGLAASYKTEEEPEMDAYVRTVFRILRKGAKKLYGVDPKSWEVNDKPYSDYFAWPEAVNQHDHVNGHYLIHHNWVYMTSKPNLFKPDSHNPWVWRNTVARELEFMTNVFVRDADGNCVPDPKIPERQEERRRCLIASIRFYSDNGLLTVAAFDEKGELIDREYRRNDFTEEGWALVCRKDRIDYYPKRGANKGQPDMNLLEKELAKIRAGK